MTEERGFPSGVRYTPVPSPLLGPLLQEIDSLAELKVTLRLLGLLHQRRGRRAWLSRDELLADPTLAEGLAQEPEGAQEALRQGLEAALRRGTFLAARREGATMLFLNDSAGRKALSVLGERVIVDVTPAPDGELAGQRPNIYKLYEDNIGVITPILAQELEQAERAYPWGWIEEAFHEAVAFNHRNWRYIQRILERWTIEGKDDGESGRHTEAADRKEYLRRYGHLAG